MQQYLDHLKKLKEEQNYRSLPGIATPEMLDLCSNDYLGINANATMQEMFRKTYEHQQRFSSCSSRLLGKKMEAHARFEEEIAAAYKAESSLLFNSGYHANTGILPAITTGNDLIIADKLIHASLIDGARLSKADFMRYRHLDYNHLENLLEKHRKAYNKVFIVSESLFSMDGDLADIHRLIELKYRFNCLLYIDEAHALGVRGAKGLGCAEEQDCISETDFIVGTLGKAMASMGAFVVSRQLFKDYLINFSRPLIFSTAIPPLNVEWSRFVFRNVTQMQTERKKLKDLSANFSSLMNIKSDSHIFPLIIGSNKAAIEKSRTLKNHGYNVLPVRFPTVPRNTARLRFSLSSDMNIKQLTPLKKLTQSSTTN